MPADDRVGPRLRRPVHCARVIVSPAFDARWPEARRHRTALRPTQPARRAAIFRLAAESPDRAMSPAHAHAASSPGRKPRGREGSAILQLREPPRRRFSRTCPRLEFQPLRIWRAHASKNSSCALVAGAEMAGP